jgi:hypothetical protein
VRFRIPRRALLALAAALSLPIAAPVVASAATGQTFKLSATSLGAGTDPNLSATTGFDPAVGAGTPKTITLDLAPGLLASAAANPSCLTGTPQLASTTPGKGCDIGSGTLTLASLVTAGYDLYLVPPASASQIAGVELVTTADGSASGSISLRAAPTVGLNASLDLSTLTVSSTLTGISLDVSGTLGGQPFTRLPTSCKQDSTTIVVTYSGTPASETSSNSTPFTPSCGNLAPFAPQLSVSATEDAGDSNAMVTTAITQASNEAADRTLELMVPPDALSPNVSNAVALLNSGKSVGTAVASSPLFPVPITGNVTLTGTALAPNLTIRFANPLSLVLQGAVSLTNSSVTFSDIPDLPLADLAVTLDGGQDALYMTTCSPGAGTLTGAFASQNGVSATSNASFTVAGCTTPVAVASKPTVFGASLIGIAKGKGKARLELGAAQGAKPIERLVVTPPSGIGFEQLKQGISAKGGAFKVAHGTLTITFAKPVSRARITIASPALRVSGKLARKVRAELKKRNVRTLAFEVKITDSGNASTTIRLRVKPTS